MIFLNRNHSTFASGSVHFVHFAPDLDSNSHVRGELRFIRLGSSSMREGGIFLPLSIFRGRLIE